MTLRVARSAVLLLTGLATIILNQIMTGYPALFGIALTVGALLTVSWLFIHFNEPFDPFLIMELVADGFAGIVIFTYPHSGELFFMIVFSFWIVFMGILFLGSGVIRQQKKDKLAVYLISGIMLVVLGFVTINYTSENMGSVNYLIGFATVVYSVINIYLLMSKKRGPHPPPGAK